MRSNRQILRMQPEEQQSRRLGLSCDVIADCTSSRRLPAKPVFDILGGRNV
jgi:hypothetical protein